MENKSISTLLEWLRAKPRTLGWDAICAYDRKKTNSVLLQDYINRFEIGNYLDPLNEKIASQETDTHLEWIYDYVFDSPRLSFLHSPLMDSKAKLSMKVIGGAHLTYERPVGADHKDWSLVRLALEDALDGPIFKQDIRLEVVKGEIVEPGKSSIGQVRLDLGAGTDSTLTFSESEHFRKLAGERIRQRLEMSPPHQRYYALNDIIVKDGDILEPDRFYIRTQQAPGADILGAENEGDGAVVLLIAMKGRDNGSFPTEEDNLMYLIPDGNEYSATQLISHQLIMEKVLTEIFETLNTPPYDFKANLQSDGAFKMLSVEGGVVYGGHGPLWTLGTGDWGAAIFQLMDVYIPFDSSDGGGRKSLELRLRNEELITKWQGIAPHRSVYKHGGPGSSTARVRVLFDGLWRFKFHLDSSSGTVVLLPTDTTSPEVVFDTWEQELLEIHPEYKPMVTGLVVDFVRPKLQAIFSVLQNSSISINAYALNSLLFRSPDAVKLNDVHFPGDLLLLGKLGEKFSQFIIDPLEPVIGHSAPHLFTVQPPEAKEGLTWSVHHVLEDTGEIGEIDATSGLYRPPTAAQLPAGFTRVRVTASKGEYQSSALVHVMVADISINPLIVTCGPNGAKRDLSAGTLSGQLVWDIPDKTSGASIDEHPTEKGKYVFTSGPKVTDKAFTFDEVVVENTTTGNKQSAHVMLLHGIPDLAVRIDETASLPENQLQLVAYFKSTGNPVPSPLLEWDVLLGAATVDKETGICTVNSAGQHKFAVATAYLPPPMEGYPSLNGFIILPIPAFSPPQAIQLLSPGND